jgi:hypothetical protein
MTGGHHVYRIVNRDNRTLRHEILGRFDHPLRLGLGGIPRQRLRAARGLEILIKRQISKVDLFRDGMRHAGHGICRECFLLGCGSDLWGGFGVRSRLR